MLHLWQHNWIWLRIAVKLDRILTRSVSTCLPGGSTSIGDDGAAHEWRRKMRRLPYMGARDELGGRAITDGSTSLQLTADLCDLNLAARKKRDPEGRAARGGPGKNRRVLRRTGIRLSVGRPDQDTLNNSSPRSSAGSNDRQPPCVFALRVECASTLFPRSKTTVTANLHAVFLIIIYIPDKERGT